MGKLSKKQYKELEELESEDTKLCSDCKKIKPLYEFGIHANKRKFAQAICLRCGRQRSKENSIFRNFGITLEQYDKILEKQSGGCKICGTKTPRGKGRFSVDHDHLTGKIRGLLCNNCNHVLGNAKDNIKILAAAIQYLIDSRK